MSKDKIYVDYFFHELLPENFAEKTPYFNLKDYKSVVDGNVIAFAYYQEVETPHGQKALLDILDWVSSKFSHIFIIMIETINENFKDFDELLHKKYNNITVFAEICTNYRSDVITSVTWFMGPHNLYATLPYSKRQIAEISSALNTKKPFLFDCLLGKQRNHRDVIENFYLNSNIKDRFIFTYFKEDIKQGQWEFDASQYTNTAELYTSDELQDGTVFCVSHTLPVDVYKKSHYSIVAETSTANNFNFYTEKVAKPIVSLRPFIVFAGANYLKNLRALGFKTFDGIIDESYDNIYNDLSRFNKAWEEVIKLSSQDPIQVIKQCQEILEHNQQHFLKFDWTKNCKEIFLTNLQHLQA